MCLAGTVASADASGPPGHADPGAGEDADGVGVVAAAALGASVDGSGPGRGLAGIVGEASEGLPEAQPADQKLAAARDHVRPVAVGKQAVVADAVKSVRQHVEQNWRMNSPAGRRMTLGFWRPLSR